MNVKDRFAIALLLILCSCGPVPINRSGKDIIYVDGRGESAWVFTKNSNDGDGASIRSDYISIDRYILRYIEYDDVRCAIFSDDHMAFGVPKEIQEGSVFKCKETTFKVERCFNEDCQSSLINGEWRTGISPDYRKIPFQFIYNQCFGVTSISLTGFFEDKEYVGAGLELRGKFGVLADIEGGGCDGNPISELF